LHLLDRPSSVSVDEAARELGCAIRTIWRDLKVLEDAGFPIYSDRAADGRRSTWKIQEEFRVGLPLKRSLSEVAALLMSRDLLAATGTGAIGPALSSAFQKVGRALSKDARALLERMRDTIGVRAFGATLQEPVAQHLQQLQAALLDRRRLGMRYHSLSRDAETERRVDPYQLTLQDGGFYLIGHCHLRQAGRIFAGAGGSRAGRRGGRPPGPGMGSPQGASGWAPTVSGERPVILTGRPPQGSGSLPSEPAAVTLRVTHPW
jgi:predicted DNA-binding transcriptional regulator YafY